MTPPRITEKQILIAPDSEYMCSNQLDFFKEKLQELHKLTSARILKVKEQMVSPMGYSDPNDRASSEEQSNIALKIVEREQKLLPKIQKALERIRLKEYGYCLESGDPIGILRLLVRPTAEFCAEVKTLKEIKEHHFRY